MPIKLDLPEETFAVASIPVERYPVVLESLRDISGYLYLARDRDEITLVVAESVWQGIASLFPEVKVQTSWRMIRFDIVLDFSVVGFIAEISQALAAAHIPILSLSSFRTDTILVPAAAYTRAIAALNPALVTLNYTILAQH